jgi:hypothetical protein
MADARLRDLYRSEQLEDQEYRLLRVLGLSERAVPICTLLKAKARANETALVRLVDGSWASTEGCYLAVSYTWGGQPLDKHVILNGLQVPVTRSCFDVVHSVSKYLPLEKPILWIDQLCVDQENEGEKSRQVMLMNQIYASASMAVIWLDQLRNLSCLSTETPKMLAEAWNEAGLDPNDLSSAESSIDQVAVQKDLKSELEETRALIKYLADYIEVEAPAFVRGCEPSPPSPQLPESVVAWDHVLAIVNHRYFERRWIIQEIANIKTQVALLLGDQLVSLDLLFNCAAQLKLVRWGLTEEFNSSIPPRAMQKLQESGNANECLFRTAEIRRERKAGASLPLLSLLTRCRNFQTTDIRDRVYALRPLASDENLPAPNYGLSIEELVIRLARYHVMQGQGNMIIEQAGLAFRNVESNIPSWCPTWEGMLPCPFNDGITREKSGFAASGSTAPRIIVVGDGSLLRVRGAIIDEVQAVTSVAMTPGPGGINREAVASIRALIPEKRLSNDEFEELVAPFNQTQATSERVHRLGESKFINIETLLLQLFVPDERLETAEHTTGANRLVGNLLIDLDESRCFRGRCFCVTNQGHVGLVPKGVQPGDQVAIISGVNVTTILRTDVVHNDRLQIVGDSYFVGVGRGEAMDLDYYTLAKDLVIS